MAQVRVKPSKPRKREWGRKAINDSKNQNPKLLLLFALVTNTFAAAIVYGWPAFRQNLLQKEGSSLSEEELGLIFTIGSWSTQGGRFFVGVIRDRFLGTRIPTAACILATAVGICGVAFAPKDDAILFTMSFFLVGLGAGAQLCLQPVASLFDDQWHGTIIASFSGAAQLSGLLFLILVSITADRRKGFGVFALFLTGLAMLAIKLLPEEFSRTFNKEEKETEMEEHKINVSISNDDDDNNCVKIIQDSDENDDRDCEEDQPHILEKKNLMSLIMTTEYVLLLTWFLTQLIGGNYYVGSIGFQLERMGDQGWYTFLFSILFASSAVAAPFIGKIGDVFGLGYAQGIATLFVPISLFMLTLERRIPLYGHIVGMTCFGIGRMVVFGTFSANVGKRFGFQHYGTLAGLGMLVSALFSLVQYPLIYASAAGNEQTVNITCGSVMLLQGIPYSIWLTYREKNLNWCKARHAP